MTTIEESLWREVLLSRVAQGRPMTECIEDATSAVAAYRDVDPNAKRFGQNP